MSHAHLIRLDKETFCLLTLEYPPVILTTKETEDSLLAIPQIIYDCTGLQYIDQLNTDLTWRICEDVGGWLAATVLCVTTDHSDKPLYIRTL